MNRKCAVVVSVLLWAIVPWFSTLDTVAQEQPGHRWGSDPVDISAFKSAVEKLAAAAGSRLGFKTLEAGLDFDKDGQPISQVSVWLPGAEACYASSGGEYYLCTATLHDRELAIKEKRELAKAIATVTGLDAYKRDWGQFAPPPGSEDFNESEMLGTFGESRSALFFYDDKRKIEWSVDITYGPLPGQYHPADGKCVPKSPLRRRDDDAPTIPDQDYPADCPDGKVHSFAVRVGLTSRQEVLRMQKGGPPPGGWPRKRGNPSPTIAVASTPSRTANSADPIRDQVEAIEASGQYLRMPTANAAASTSSIPSGMVERIVENATAYRLTVLITGPVSREIDVDAGATQTLTLPAGLYKVAARVRAASVLPFFGTETYSPSYSYQSRFYIK